jgi:hypothetical protein
MDERGPWTGHLTKPRRSVDPMQRWQRLWVAVCVVLCGPILAIGIVKSGAEGGSALAVFFYGLAALLIALGLYVLMVVAASVQRKFGNRDAD